MSRQSKELTDARGIKTVTTVSDIELDSIYPAEYQKEGTLTAQLKQTVHKVSSYPSKKVTSDKQAGLFATDDFAFGATDFENTETRVAWLPIPVAATEEQVKAKLALVNSKNAMIYRVLSNHPILDDNQKYGIANPALPDFTLDTVANAQAVRYPLDHEQAGQICPDANGKVQYRRTFFWDTFMEDQDLRSTDPVDVYMTEDIKAELLGASILEGQKVSA